MSDVAGGDLAITDDDVLIQHGGLQTRLWTSTFGNRNGRRMSQNTMATSNATSMNIATGDTGFVIPLTMTNGLGPQPSLSLSYHTMARGLTPPQVRDHLSPGWRLNPVPRVWHVPGAPAYLETSNGDTILVGSDTTDIFLRLTRDPAELTWELEMPDGTRQTFLPSGQISTTIDSSGNTLTYEYEDNPLVLGEQENLVRLVDAKGRTTALRYDANNLLEEIEDPEHKLHRFAYYVPGETEGRSDQHALKTVTRIRTDGKPDEVWTFTYHAETSEDAACPDDPMQTCPTKHGYLAMVTNPRGFTSQYYYEIGGRLARVINAAADHLTVSYEQIRDTDTPPVSSTVCTDGIDTLDLRTMVTNWRGHLTTFESDFETSMVWFVRDPLAATTRGGTIERSYGSYRRILCAKDKNVNPKTTYAWIPGTPGDFVKFYLSEVHLPMITNPLKAMPEFPTIRYTYDMATHEVLTVKNPNDHVTTSRYDDPRNPHLVTTILEPSDEPLGDVLPTTVMTYDAQGRLKTHQDPKEHIREYMYDEGTDATGLVTSIKHPPIAMGSSEAIEKFTYTTMGLLRTQKQPAHAEDVLTVYDYDDAYRLERVTRPATADHPASSTSYAYDPNGNTETITDPLTKITTYTYDALDRRTKVTRHDTTFAETHYDENGNSHTSIDFNTNRTTRVFNELNRMTELHLPEGMRLCYEHDPNGNVLLVKELALGETCVTARRVTEYTVDEWDRRIEEQLPDPEGRPSISGPVTKVAYDHVSNWTILEDPLTNTYTQTYTDRELRKELKRPGLGDTDEHANRIDFGHDLNGNQNAVTVWRQGSPWAPHTISLQHNARNLVSKVTDPLLRDTVLQYDDNGNRMDVIDARGMITHATYDERNRTKTVTRDFGAGRLNLMTTMAYDKVGNVASTIDAKDTTITYAYDDDLHRLKTITSPLGVVASYIYDDNGNQKTITDGNEHAHQYEYDKMNRLKKVTDPLGVVVADYTYDEFGDLRTRTDGNRVTTEYVYDALHRLTKTIYPDSADNITRTYDDNNNLKTITDANTDLAYTYDGLDRLEEMTDNRLDRRLQYAYDSFNNRTTLRTYAGTDPAPEETIAYCYDDAEQLDRIVQNGTCDGGGDVYDYDYYPDGTMKQLTRPNGSYTEYLYDTAKRLSHLNNHRSNDRILSGFHSLYDKVDNRTFMEVTLEDRVDHAIDYTYDDLYRLKTETRTVSDPYANIWTYDIVGNRMTQHKDGVPTTYVYNDANALTEEIVGTAITDDFADPTLTAWNIVQGLWRVQGGILHAGGTPGSGTGGGGGTTGRGPREGLIVHTHPEPNEHTIQVDIERLRLRAAGGVIIRQHDTRNFTRVELTGLPLPRVTVVQRIGGRDFPVATTPYLPLDWNTLRVQIEGARILEVAVNDITALTDIVVDPAPDQVGLYVREFARFDNFSLLDAEIIPYFYDDNGNLLQRGTSTETFEHDVENRLIKVHDLGKQETRWVLNAYGYPILMEDDVRGRMEFFLEGSEVLVDIHTDGTETVYLRDPVVGKILRIEPQEGALDFLNDPAGSVTEATNEDGDSEHHQEYTAFGETTKETGDPDINRQEFQGMWCFSLDESIYYDPQGGFAYLADPAITSTRQPLYPIPQPAVTRHLPGKRLEEQYEIAAYNAEISRRNVIDLRYALDSESYMWRTQFVGFGWLDTLTMSTFPPDRNTNPGKFLIWAEWQRAREDAAYYVRFRNTARNYLDDYDEHENDVRYLMISDSTLLLALHKTPAVRFLIRGVYGIEGFDAYEMRRLTDAERTDYIIESIAGQAADTLLIVELAMPLGHGATLGVRTLQRGIRSLPMNGEGVRNMTAATLLAMTPADDVALLEFRKAAARLFAARQRGGMGLNSRGYPSDELFEVLSNGWIHRLPGKTWGPPVKRLVLPRQGGTWLDNPAEWTTFAPYHRSYRLDIMKQTNRRLQELNRARKLNRY